MASAHQLPLPGFADFTPSPKRAFPKLPRTRGQLSPYNIFLAIVPDQTAGFQMGQIAQTICLTHGLFGNPLGLSRFHVSLHRLEIAPAAPKDLAPKLTEIFGPLAAAISPFEIGFDRALTFKSNSEKKPFVLRNSQHNLPLMDMHRLFGRVLDSPGRTFTPHVTLLYDRKEIGEHSITPVNWIANELVLVYGTHEHLARWPFRN